VDQEFGAYAEIILLDGNSIEAITDPGTRPITFAGTPRVEDGFEKMPFITKDCQDLQEYGERMNQDYRLNQQRLRTMKQRTVGTK
jgi:hypothetical protein